MSSHKTNLPSGHVNAVLRNIYCPPSSHSVKVDDWVRPGEDLNSKRPHDKPYQQLAKGYASVQYKEPPSDAEASKGSGSGSK
jgi:hypothetical protein